MTEKKKLTLAQWHRDNDAKGRAWDLKRMAKLRKKLELRQEKNLTGLKAWAATIGNLQAGKQLPF